MGPSQNRPPPMSSVCLLSVKKNFSQRINLIREVKNVERKENSQARQRNNTLAIKQSQGPLVLPQGL